MSETTPDTSWLATERGEQGELQDEGRCVQNKHEEGGCCQDDEEHALVQTYTRSNWLQALQVDLEKIRKSGMAVGNHVDQLRRRCQQEVHHYQDEETWQTALAIMAPYSMDEGEEGRGDAVDAWASKWHARLSAMLKLPGQTVLCADSQDQEEIEKTKEVILDLINREGQAEHAAEAAQAEDDEALRLAMVESGDTAVLQKYQETTNASEPEQKKQKVANAQPAAPERPARPLLPVQPSSSSESVVIVVPAEDRVHVQTSTGGQVGQVVTISLRAPP